MCNTCDGSGRYEDDERTWNCQECNSDEMFIRNTVVVNNSCPEVNPLWNLDLVNRRRDENILRRRQRD